MSTEEIPIDRGRYYTAGEAAEALASRGLRISAKSLLAMAGPGKGRIPVKRVGPNRGRVFFPGSSLLAYLDDGGQGPARVTPPPKASGAPARRPRQGRPRGWEEELAEAQAPLPARRAT
jgi:hypothetical protein